MNDTGKTRPEDGDAPRDVTAEDEPPQIALPSNRNIALLLLAVAFVFLAGAFGVAMLVSYGSF